MLGLPWAAVGSGGKDTGGEGGHWRYWQGMMLGDKKNPLEGDEQVAQKSLVQGAEAVCEDLLRKARSRDCVGCNVNGCVIAQQRMLVLPSGGFLRGDSGGESGGKRWEKVGSGGKRWPTLGEKLCARAR